MSDKARPIQRVKSNWADVVLVCRKCSKKLDGGFGPKGDQTLAKALRRTAEDAAGKGKAKGRKAPLGVIEVDCLDICPKGGVVAIPAGHPGEWLVIPRGTPVNEAAERLGLNMPNDKAA